MIFLCFINYNFILETFQKTNKNNINKGIIYVNIGQFHGSKSAILSLLYAIIAPNSSAYFIGPVNVNLA